jgi:hypothetical protein
MNGDRKTLTDAGVLLAFKKFPLSRADIDQPSNVIGSKRRHRSPAGQHARIDRYEIIVPIIFGPAHSGGRDAHQFATLHVPILGVDAGQIHVVKDRHQIESHCGGYIGKRLFEPFGRTRLGHPVDKVLNVVEPAHELAALQWESRGQANPVLSEYSKLFHVIHHCALQQQHTAPGKKAIIFRRLAR